MRHSAAVLQELQEHQTKLVSWEECLDPDQPRPVSSRTGCPNDMFLIGNGDMVAVEAPMLTADKAVREPACTAQAVTQLRKNFPSSEN